LVFLGFKGGVEPLGEDPRPRVHPAAAVEGGGRRNGREEDSGQQGKHPAGVDQHG